MKTPAKLSRIATQAGMKFSLGVGDETEIYTLHRNKYEVALSVDVSRRFHSEWYPKYLKSVFVSLQSLTNYLIAYTEVTTPQTL
jgi:hypothetical protein